MKKSFGCLKQLALMVLLSMFVAKWAWPSPLRVAVAANARYPLEVLTQTFADMHGRKVDCIVGSSGTLAVQIRNDAPFHVFVSADMSYGDSLFTWGKATARPQVYALGRLVLFSTRLKRLPQITDSAAWASIKTLVIPDPQWAPYGRAAMQLLYAYGVQNARVPRQVFANNVSQAAQLLLSGAADAGFVSYSVVKQLDVASKGIFRLLDPAAYSPIEQGAVWMDRGTASEQCAAEAFHRFLFEAEARKVFQRFGYGLPEKGEKP